MSSPPPKKAKSAKWPVASDREREYIRQQLDDASNKQDAIRQLQAERSLHVMMCKALGTAPKYVAAQPNIAVEPLDTDPVLEFLSHFGVSRLDIHKRISDALRSQLEDEIRKTSDTAPLLKLLSKIWWTATQVPELRPVVIAILKKLGTETPSKILEELSQKPEAYQELWHPLPPLLKRLVWEKDWELREGENDPSNPDKYYKLVESTMFAKKVQPVIESYCHEKQLVESANRQFVASVRERRVVTSHRRALLKGEAAEKAPAVTKAVAEMRRVLSGDTPAFRPKLLNAFLSILMARHGLVKDIELLGGATYLHCTLVADILLSGPLPKAYQQLLTLARTLDEVAKAGTITDTQISQIQSCLRQIYPSDEAPVESKHQAESAAVDTKTQVDEFTKETLGRIISSGLAAMKEADPQSLFLNPVTDEIAHGYSRVIKQPMCIKTMESKMDSYRNLQEWESDVKLLFDNCIRYNTGNAGQWFRGEARRQRKVFQDDIYPQALKHYQSAVGKRTFDRPKRKRDGSSNGADIEPLPGMKSKMQKTEVLHPSLPAVASMLLADPFVVRILLDRALRCLRIDVKHGGSIPAAHRVLPSILQLLHLASWSTRLCAIRGKRYAVPDAGMIPPTEDDIISLTPFATLRNYAPVLMRLLVESELDRRMVAGGDLQLAAQSLQEERNELVLDDDDATHLDVLRCLTEGALVHICQQTHESSLAVTFPKFDRALVHLSTNLWNQRPFFVSLIQALLRHKSKLSRATRDIVVAAWLKWLGPDNDKTKDDAKVGSMTSASHECFVTLLNEWAALGNLLLPRDAMLTFAADAVRAADSSETEEERKFSKMWTTPEFSSVRKQYERMLDHLPETQSQEWKDKVGISEAKEEEDVTMTEVVGDGSKGDEDTETKPSAADAEAS
jgi:hypothetical protein